MMRMTTLLTGSIAALFLVAGAVSQAEARRGGGGFHGGGGGFHGGGMRGGGHAFRGGGGRHMHGNHAGGRHYRGGGGNRHAGKHNGHRHAHNNRHRHGRWVNGVWVAWPGAYYGYS